MTQDDINALAVAIFALAWALSLKAAHDFGWTKGRRFAREQAPPTHAPQSAVKSLSASPTSEEGRNGTE